MTQVALTTMLKTVCRLDNLRRAPGPQGEFKTMEVTGGFKMYLTEQGDGFWPYPATMKVQWDGEVPAPRK